jgi:WD40 repeat protein
MRARRAPLAGAVLVAVTLLGCSSESTPTDDGGSENGDLAQVPGALVNPDSAALSPDGSRIAVPCDGRLCVWNTADGALADTWDGGSVVAWSLAGDVLATDRIDGETVSLVLLDAATGAEQSVTEAYSAPVVQDAPGGGFLDLVFSPDGDTVAGVGADGVVHVWSVADPDDVSEVDVAGDEAVAAAFSPDGSRVAVASSDAPVSVHDAATGDEVGSLDASPQGAVAWSADGAVIATASFTLEDEAATTIWDAQAMTPVAELPRAGDELAFAPSTDALAVTEKNKPGVLVWRWADDDVTTLSGATDNPRSVLWAPEGSALYAVSARDGVLAWDPATGSLSTRFEKPDEG